MKKLTTEEENLLCIFMGDSPSKQELLARLCDTIGEVDDRDMIRLIEKTIVLVKGMSNKEYREMTVYPAEVY